MKAGAMTMMGIDNWINFALRCSADLLPEIAVAALLLMLALAIGYKLRQSRARWRKLLALILIAVIAFSAYRLKGTVEQNMLLALLSGEDDAAAEAAFRDFGKVANSGRLRSLVLNPRQDGNVRFYAVCLLADRVNLKDTATSTQLLRGLENAPDLQAAFFQTNTVNSFHFHFPAPVSVRHLVIERIAATQGSKPAEEFMRIGGLTNAPPERAHSGRAPG